MALMIERGMMLAQRYCLLEQIDSGGMAYIYSAFDQEEKRRVALKILKPEIAEDPEHVRRFVKEVQAATKLNHPNIIRTYTAGQENGIYYLVMDLIEGKTLKHLIKVNGALPVKYVVNVAKKLCDAMEYAHAKGYVHRDIKPQNVMVDMSGEPYLTDFGIAKNVAQNSITMEDTSIMGSVYYFSPEQARGERADKRSDIYSLGITMYEMLTGEVPFDAESSVAIALKHVNEPLPVPREIMPGIPESVNRIILKATQKDKHFRYKSADSMYDDLALCLDMPEGSYIRYAESPRAVQRREEQHSRHSKRGFLKMALTIGIAAGIILVVVLLASRAVDVSVAKPIHVPNFVGMESQLAKEYAAENGLFVEMETEFSKQYQPGIVSGQMPESGGEIAQGATVQLLVSKGAGEGVVPNVTNFSLTEAKKVLLEYGIKNVTVVEDAEGEIPIGFVMQQTPLPGETYVDAEGVTLRVKISPEEFKVVVPGVTGITLEESAANLAQRGFEKILVRQQQNDAATARTVHTQEPSEGTEHMTNQPVILTVSEPASMTQYVYEGSFAVDVPSDDSKLYVLLKDAVGGVTVYYLEEEITAQTGRHVLELQLTALLNEREATATKDVVILVNGEQAVAQQVLLKREET